MSDKSHTVQTRYSGFNNNLTCNLGLCELEVAEVETNLSALISGRMNVVKHWNIIEVDVPGR